ncbi:hypothetical protein NDA13_002338 [Ustilago tritici]|nr:hypothetical protein NDA13_002338 [Ustilago tritici]
MKFAFTVSALLALAVSSQAIEFQNLQLGQGGDANAILQGFHDNNLTAFANVLSQHPAVTERILADNSEKLLLAPTDEAISKLPSWVTSNSSRLEATLLNHVLRGKFDTNDLNSYPLHTIGHSLLNSSEFSQLPGGAGQAVALSKSGDNCFVAEAVNNGSFAGESKKFDTLTIQPIKQAITVPGTVTETLRFLGYTDISTLLANVQNGALARTIDSMSGVTLFVPSNDAIQKFVATQPNPTDIPTVLGQHIVASRVLYSPLLIDQGAMISSSDQDIVFDDNTGTVKVGNFTAKILQTDIIAQQGESVDAERAQSLSGPVNGKNAITSQGNNVPAVQQGSGANNRSANDNTDTAGTGQNESAIGNGTNGNNSGASQAGTSSNGNGSNGNGSNIDHRNQNGAVASVRSSSLFGSAVLLSSVLAIAL